MYTKEAILDLMANDQGFLEGCIVRIYEKQTAAEQETKDTTQSNGIGFNKADSIRGSWYAQHILRGVSQYRKTYGTNLTKTEKVDHIAKARKFMVKYAGQLVKIFAAEHAMQEKAMAA